MKEKKRQPGRRSGHSINIFVSYELKQELMKLARQYDCTTADMVRTLLRVGMPLMEGLSKAEHLLIKEYVRLVRRYRLKQAMKDRQT